MKSPKLYFTDTGLVCHLLNLQNGKELSNSYLAGNIFENFVVNEIKKSWAKWLNKAEDLLPDLAENASIVCMTEKAFPISPSIVAHSIWQI